MRLYTLETNLQTSAETLSVKMSSVMVMDDDVKAANTLIVLLVLWSVITY